jgi:hypothetical protein
MSFQRFADVVNSQTVNGSERTSSWRKVPTQTTTAGIWYDISSAPGTPPPKYWFDSTPLVAAVVAQSIDGGLWHGSNVSPYQKCLRELMAITVTAAVLPMPMILCDYLLYYPTIDETVSGAQVMNNTATITRWIGDKTIQMIAVSDASRVGGATVTISYTNQSGVSGQTTTFIENAVSVTGSLVNSAVASSTANPYSTGAFIQLQQGDTGVTSIQSVTVNGSGDTGLFSLVLVKPLCQFSVRGIDAPTEVDYLRDFPVMPIIQDDAYLSFLCLPQGSLSGVQTIGTIKTTFN